MKIIFHHRIRSRDGQFIHLREMQSAFKELGHEVTLIGPTITEDKGSFGSGGGLINLVRKNLPLWIGESLEIIYGIWATVRLAIKAFLIKPDLIYERFNLYSPAGVIVCKILSIPIVLEINAPLFEEREAYGGISMKRIAKWSQTFTWTSASLCCPVSNALAEKVIEAGVKPTNILVRHNGIDPKRFNLEINRSEAKRELGIDGKCVIGFIGFLRKWHRVDRVIRAIKTKNLPNNTHLLIVGDGPELNNIKKLVKELSIEDRVTFLGLIHWEKIPKILATVDIALQPAVTEYASPLKLIEYLAAGKAIIAPTQKNILELIKDKQNGWLLYDDSEEALLTALKELSTNAHLRDLLGKNAAQTINDMGLTWTENVEAVINKIKRM